MPVSICSASGDQLAFLAGVGAVLGLFQLGFSLPISGVLALPGSPQKLDSKFCPTGSGGGV